MNVSNTCHRHPRSITPRVPNQNCRQFQSCPVKRAIARRVSPDPNLQEGVVGDQSRQRATSRPELLSWPRPAVQVGCCMFVERILRNFLRISINLQRHQPSNAAAECRIAKAEPGWTLAG
ncbi:unnamed protein product [Plutella xylostella]|uniref:(diamondback moth) hypothetical protein n=1 Tax=Plutella xylostella TaxID=51655 RepID=A0A8S4GCR5_PLUXY|nr:unnamed protein product [Plutella xylostella]